MSPLSGDSKMTQTTWQQWPREFPEAWASDWGRDEKGLWMAFKLQGVRYAFRWIEPGTFMMGSPKNESGRGGNETQHEVTLTKGFWLGETTVPQALWQAVMGENPSDFKGEDLPVDSVSWNDCGQFIKKLHKGYPEFNLCLPTEAQWEYACRAGATTAFSFGDTITTDQVNYDGNYPNEGSPEGEYRGKTVPVKALPANGWGLYQMQGNLWEWCEDWLDDYQEDAQVNPGGPDSGQYRVLRGGSWISGGGGCRSADRRGVHPGDADCYFGFRLARGQEALKQAPDRTEAGDRHRSELG